MTFNQKHLDSDFIDFESQYLDPENPKTSASWILAPFVIDDTGGGDYTWVEASNNTWCSGTGTWNDPYLIENITIDGGNIGSCIEVRNSNVFFVIRNSNLYNSGPLSWPPNARIELNNITNGRIIKNKLYSNGSQGIYLYYSNNLTISENIINVSVHEGIILDKSNNNSIIDNEISNSEIGLNIVSSNGTIVSGNTISESTVHGILSSYSNYGLIHNNNLLNNNMTGFWVFESKYTSITENNINNSETSVAEGLLISDGSDNVIITENNITDCTYWGIHSAHSNNGLIYDNYVFNNDNGISLEDSNNTLVYYNIFINNTKYIGTARDDGVDNEWDNGTIGNYWSDYSGVDNNDDGIGDTPHHIAGSAGAQDNFPIWDDGPYVPPPPPEPFDNTFLMILLLSVPLGLLGLITGQSFGKRRKFVKLYSDLESESGWAKRLEGKKLEYNKLSTEIKKIEKDQDIKLQELQEQINIKEDYLLEGRVEQRISYYKQYNEIIQTFEEMKDGLETEILSKTQLKKNVIELKKAKKAVEEKLEQIKKEHNSNLKTIQEVILKEEEEWKNKRSEKKTNLELEFKSRENKLEQEKEMELQKIHVDIQEEIQRRIQEQKRDALKEKRDDLIRKLKVFEENFLDEVEARIQKLKANMPNLSANLSSKSGIKDTISIISSNISTIEELINNQRNIESVSDDIINRISRINKNIRSISSKMELQRASPVFAIPSKDKEKGLFYTTLKMDFRCELCHKLMKEVEVKERRKWLRWSLLGIRAVLEFVKLDYINPIVEFAEDHLIGEMLKEVSVDLSSENRFVGMVQELKDRKIEPDLNLDEKNFDEAIKNKESREKIETYIVNHHKFFVDTIKPTYTLQNIQDLCDKRERVYWQIFSQDEQENLRRFLKESGNASLYTTDLQLKYGIFVCNDCESWIEILEDKSHTYRGEK